MRPPREDIAAPELPPRTRWLNAERKPAIAALTATGPLLVHFFDFAQLNSVRALPYVVAWVARYEAAGLATLGVHSPRYPYTKERKALAGALDRLGVRHPVADDSSYAIWHDYGCRGWPSLFLWSRGGALAWYHFGEGDYAATETAIQEELRALDITLELPAPLEPLRPSDAPGALVAPPSAEVFPGGSASEPWRPESAELPLRLGYAAGGAHAAVDGSGELRVAIDGEERAAIAVDAPGLYDLAEHPRHSEHELALSATPGLGVYSIAFSAGLP